jgi:hypothetical protein
MYFRKQTLFHKNWFWVTFWIMFAEKQQQEMKQIFTRPFQQWSAMQYK